MSDPFRRVHQLLVRASLRTKNGGERLRHSDDALDDGLGSHADERRGLRPGGRKPFEPIVEDVERARRHPEVALLSALAHRGEPIALSIARALFVALDDVDELRASRYADIVLGFVDEAVRRALDAEMNPEKYEFRSEFMRRIVAAGEARCEVRGEARALLKVLEARGVQLADE